MQHVQRTCQACISADRFHIKLSLILQTGVKQIMFWASPFKNQIGSSNSESTYLFIQLHFYNIINIMDIFSYNSNSQIRYINFI